MRPEQVLTALLFPLVLFGCGPEAVGIAAAVSGASIPVFHRTPVDMAVTVATGRDCSIVNLDKSEGDCLPKERAPGTPAFFTPSPGVADFWGDPAQMPNPPPGVADGPPPPPPHPETQRPKRG